MLACSPIGLEATFSAWIDDELRMSLNVTNRGAKPLSFKLAFPHLAGLALSEKPSADYYHFPWGGGIISDAPAVIRRGYGDYAALYQVMDLFSPSRGAGLMIRSTDEDGRHKVLALRKHIPGEARRNGDAAQTPTSEEFKWTNPLAPVPGVSVAYECLRRLPRAGGKLRRQGCRAAGPCRRLARGPAGLRRLVPPRVEVPAISLAAHTRRLHHGPRLGTEFPLPRRRKDVLYAPERPGAQLCRAGALA